MVENAPVSIIVRSMDRPSLSRALNSLAGQQLKPREIVVVAACGRRHRPLPDIDPTIRVSLVFPPDTIAHLPRAAAANAGLRAATSEWLGFLDDDDELLPNHVATLLPVAQQAHAARGRDGRLAYSLAQGVDALGNKTSVYGRSFTWVRFWESTILHTMNGLFHRSLLDDGCLFDESLDIHEDWDFWLQCAQHTAFTYVETVTSLWHGAEGESGCGFGANLNETRYKEVQQQVQQKWAAQRTRILGAMQQAGRDAVAANARGDINGAIGLCQWVLRRDPENVNAANLLGMISLRRGDLTSAHQLMTVAIGNSPPHFGLYYNMGLIEDARGQAGVAQDWYRKALALNPAHAGLQEKLAAHPPR
jgi:hypothetical protein